MSKVKVEDDEELPFSNLYPWQIGDNIASSSSSHVRLSFIEMGFPPSLVDKAIEENGEDNEDMLLDTLTRHSALGNMKPGGLLVDDNEPSAVRQPREEVPQISFAESSDSLDSLFGEKNDASNHADFPADINLKEEPDVSSGVRAEKRASLLMMNFSMDEVDYAIDKLGEDAPISGVVDFISAAQIAETNVNCANYCDEVKNEDSSTETLFGMLNNTVLLLDMGFSEKEISAAIDICGSEASVAKLADSIVSGQIDKYTSTSHSLKRSMHEETCRSFAGVNRQVSLRFDELPVKSEEYSPAVSQSSAIGIVNKSKGKRQEEGFIDNSSSLKRPKEEYDDASLVLPPWLESRQGISKLGELPISRGQGKERKLTRNSPSLPKPDSCRSLDAMVAKPPYFFYGNVMNLSHDSWNKISQFLYAIEPEFVDTHLFSALSRKEGYVHNLPTDNRSYIIPKSPMTIRDAVPSTKKWWPSWDTREQISCISADTTEISKQRDKLEKLLIESGGLLSIEQQRDLLHRCKLFNLVWVGLNKLRAIGPEHLERILGYPVGHTEAVGFSHKDRLQSLKHCFQIDTLGYHLSVLKTLFPDGLTLLSIHSGVGGSEITLDRLGIRLKGVVSVEPCETKRMILKQWWSNSGQSGELVQIEDMLKLSSSKLEILKNKFGGFDFIICQTPITDNEDGNGFADMDFSLFFEFVRILQRVR